MSVGSTHLFATDYGHGDIRSLYQLEFTVVRNAIQVFLGRLAELSSANAHAHRDTPFVAAHLLCPRIPKLDGQVRSQVYSKEWVSMPLYFASATRQVKDRERAATRIDPYTAIELGLPRFWKRDDERHNDDRLLW